MTDINLMDELVVRLIEIFMGYELKNRKGDLQQVHVYSQYLPQSSGVTKGIGGYSESDYESNFPCVVCKFGDHTDSEEIGKVPSASNITLLFGIYDDGKDCQGWRDILNMMQKVRLEFLNERVLAKKYMLNMPLKSKLLEADTWPVYFGEMNMNFMMPRPVMGHGFVYGKE